MRAKVQVTIGWELASPDDYPGDVNTWIQAAQYDIENCIYVTTEIDTSIVYGVPELDGEPESEPFVRPGDLNREEG